MTNWSLIVTFIYFIIISCVTPSRVLTSRFSALFNLALVIEGFILVFFWAVLFPQVYKKFHGFKFFELFFAHLVPTISLTIDFFMNKIVIRASLIGWELLFIVYSECDSRKLNYTN